MYPVSDEYRREMNRQIREAKAHVRIYMGLFDVTAAPDASVSLPEKVEYSTPADVVFGKVDTSYASFEPSFFRLDAKQRLLPKTAETRRPQGWISESRSEYDGTFVKNPVLVFSFGVPHTFAGVTLNFGTILEEAPASVKVTAKTASRATNTQTYDNPGTVLKAELLVSDADSVEVEFLKTRAPGGRARLNQIDFGIGYTYQNEDVIEISEKHTDAPVSTSLATASLNFKLDDQDRRFDVDGKSSLVEFLSAGQPVQVDYGVEIDGKVEWVPSGVWNLVSWKQQAPYATFAAEDALAGLTKTNYEKGLFDQKDRTLYELAEAVFKDAGVERYYIDPKLKDRKTAAPLTIQSHAACLQVIANRGLARLYTARDGRISLTCTNYHPVYSERNPGTGFFTEYSKAQSVLDKTGQQYATFEPDYFRVDGTQRLLPKGGETSFPAGLTGSIQARDDGQFDENMAWWIVPQSPSDVYTVDLDFGGQPPEQIAFRFQSEGNWGDPIWFDVTGNIMQARTNQQHITGFVLYFHRMRKPGQRAHLSSIDVSPVSDIELNGSQIFPEGTAELGTKLRNVTAQWMYRSYYPGVTQEVASVQAVTNGEWIRIEHEGVFNPKITCKDPSVNIEQENYTYVSYARLTKDSGESVPADIVVSGDKLFETPYPIMSVGNETGEDLPVESPLYDNPNMQDALDWMRDYYMRRVLRTLDARGLPEVDCGDFVRGDDGKVYQVIGTELKYNGAFRETFKLRGD